MTLDWPQNYSLPKDSFFYSILIRIATSHPADLFAALEIRVHWFRYRLFLLIYLNLYLKHYHTDQVS